MLSKKCILAPGSLGKARRKTIQQMCQGQLEVKCHCSYKLLPYPHSAGWHHHVSLCLLGRAFLLSLLQACWKKIP